MRLAGPWHFEVLERYDAPGKVAERGPASGTVKLPADWSATFGSEFCGRVRYTRGFNMPTNLDPHESVWLIVEGADAAAAVSLNGQLLGEQAGYALAFERDVTALLERRNELQIDVELPRLTPKYEQAMRPGRHGLAGGLTGEVRLEVRARHFIHRLQVELIETEGSEVMLHVAGKIEGPERVDPLLLVVSGWSGELLATEVVAGKHFDVAKAIERLARMDPNGDGLPGLTKLLIRLIEGGTRVWEKTLETGHRTIRFDLPPEKGNVDRKLLLNDQPYRLPLRAFQISDRQPTPLPDDASEPLLAERIFRDEEYAQFDRLGLCIVQAVPAAWIDEVCPRLSHHPSIVAWAVPRAWLQQGAGVERALAWLAGSSRPWIASELVVADGVPPAE